MDMSPVAQATQNSGIWTWLPARLRRMARDLNARRQRRLLLWKLLELDDHLLKDIGFRRDEVVEAMRTGGLPSRAGWDNAVGAQTNPHARRSRETCAAAPCAKPCRT